MGVSSRAKATSKSLEAVSLTQKIYHYTLYFFLYLYTFALILAIIDAGMARLAPGINFSFLPNENLLQSLIDLWFAFWSGLGIIINFIGDVIFNGKVDIDPFFVWTLKFGSSFGQLPVSTLFDMFNLPFRLLTLVNNNSATWVGIKIWVPGTCKVANTEYPVYGGINIVNSCASSTVPDYNALHKIDVIGLWVGVDLKGAIDFGLMINTNGMTIPVFGKLGSEHLSFAGTISIGSVYRSFAGIDGLHQMTPFGFLLNIDTSSIPVVGDTLKRIIFGGKNYIYGSLSDMLLKYLQNLSNSLGSWKDIYDKVIQNNLGLPSASSPPTSPLGPISIILSQVLTHFKM